MATAEEIFGYLDEVRESGATNMFGAGLYVAEEFNLDAADARKFLTEWMRTFDPSKSPAERAAFAEGLPS